MNKCDSCELSWIDSLVNEDYPTCPTCISEQRLPKGIDDKVRFIRNEKITMKKSVDVSKKKKNQKKD